MDELDWVVANGGADIRHAGAEGGGWSADDGWEQHIDWRWVSPLSCLDLTAVQHHSGLCRFIDKTCSRFGDCCSLCFCADVCGTAQ